jgi:hypothetical protein
MVKEKYVQMIIDITREKRCVKRSVIIDIIAENLGEDRKKVEIGVREALKRLVETQVIKRKARGIYCFNSNRHI